MKRSSIAIALVFIVTSSALTEPVSAGDIHSSTPPICLAIHTIREITCFEDAAPAGDCLYSGDFIICTVSEPTDVPLWLSWYNPQLCYLGHTINCGGSPEHFATMPVTLESYEWAAACPAGWTYYGRTRTFTTAATGTRICVDRGGAIRPVWREVYTPKGFTWAWVIIVDILAHERPDYAYTMQVDWSLDWTD